MNHIDDTRKSIDAHWKRLLDSGKSVVQLMEICGTHTVAISRGGLRSLLPEALRLVSGPGCPVCVTEQSYVDAAIHLARRDDVIIATYGDMLRVPGGDGSLEQASADGCDVRVIYAAHRAVEIARSTPEKQIVFLATGFETTAPATALAIRQARAEGITNFSALTAHKLVTPAMSVLLSQPDIRIDGFLCPGHVSVITGWRAYEPLVEQFARPCVVAGFDDEQILNGICEILRQLANGAPAACSVYSPVSADGNEKARQIIEDTFDTTDARWRALGVISVSGLELKDEFADFDAAKRFDLPEFDADEPAGCRCGDVITGRCLPTDCPLFGNKCTPREPVGPCMVSSEGSCAAYYKYGVN
ncbi:MAG: hydrogenase formation protein HypD [Phycisphaerae bacterium]|nr:hydrogenase formation protein HypD [Phycisphaerae bacterium]